MEEEAGHTVLRSRVVSTSLCSRTGVWGMVPKGRLKSAACRLPFRRPERIYHFVHFSFLEVKARLQFVIPYLIRKCLCIINLTRTVFQPSAGSSLVSFSKGAGPAGVCKQMAWPFHTGFHTCSLSSIFKLKIETNV